MLRKVSLADRYDLNQSTVLLTGTQAIIRAALARKAIDRAAGLDTGGYITGYRGSPLGGLDQQVVQQLATLQSQDIHFTPGVNEDLAATALWGTQQAEMRGEGRLDGVFGIWYGKGPGVDRSGDALRHANLAGTSPNGGVIALMGDDHMCESSTTAHHSEYAFMDAMIPVLHPAGVQEVFDYCLAGWALSRYCGCWVGIKLVKDTVESTAVITADLERLITPSKINFTPPESGLHIRPADSPLAQERRLIEQKIPAATAFVQTLAIDQIKLPGGPSPKVGIVATGKSYLDVLQALDELNIDEKRAADIGLRLLKVGCVWPLDEQCINQFATGLHSVLVVEEKRPVIEPQIQQILYNQPDRPTILGKRDPSGAWLLPAAGVLDSTIIADAIGKLIKPHVLDPALIDHIDAAGHRLEATRQATDIVSRPPHFCAGCPHNRSTIIPEGTRAYAGIGCHYLVQGMDRNNEGYTHMGAEGANWIGEQIFSSRQHMFQNVGDGTYSHSGLMAIRAAKASGTSITFKILFNDAVALTGGQPLEGDLSVADIARDMAALQLARVSVVTDEPEKYPRGYFPAGVTIHHRDDLLTVQREMAAIDGVTALIYDQTCAAEKRRRRKRGTFPDPDKRVLINERVCEGCGDCGQKSNCIAIQPAESLYGRKRRIDQSACNKDFSCLDGFCPSFVTVTGAALRKSKIDASSLRPPAPRLPEIGHNYTILVTGIGGTGVVTIGAVLAMAAHLEGKGCGVIDMSGLAQKGGAVSSHVRIANAPDDIKSIRIGTAGADLLLGCDIAVAGTAKSLASLATDRSAVVANTHEVLPGAFTRDGAYSLPVERVVAALRQNAGPDYCQFLDATELATALCGDAIATNMFMLGFAYQNGRIPVSEAAILEAIALNGVAVEMNCAAFQWGRQAAVDLDGVIDRVRDGRTAREMPKDLSAQIDHFTAELTRYQDADYASCYADLVTQVQQRELQATNDDELPITQIVAHQLYRLSAIKDEYEVGRLFVSPEFKAQLDQTFTDIKSVKYYLAPPIFARTDPQTGAPKKRQYGRWIEPVFQVLSACRGIRNTVFDPFRYTAERRMNQKLLEQYRADIADVLPMIGEQSATEIAAFLGYPVDVKGFGHIRKQSMVQAVADRKSLRDRLMSEPVVIDTSAA